MHDEGKHSVKVSVSPKKKPVVNYMALQISEDEWVVYEDGRRILVNLKEFQAKSIAAILNVQ